MGNVGGQLGNNNASKKNRMFKNALRRTVKQGKGDANRLRKIANKLCEEAEAGNIPAIVVVRDSLDGRPNQAVTTTETKQINIVQRVIVNQVIDNNEVIEGETVTEVLPVPEDSE